MQQNPKTRTALAAGAFLVVLITVLAVAITTPNGVSGRRVVLAQPAGPAPMGAGPAAGAGAAGAAPPGGAAPAAGAAAPAAGPQLSPATSPEPLEASRGNPFVEVPAQRPVRLSPERDFGPHVPAGPGSLGPRPEDVPIGATNLVQNQFDPEGGGKGERIRRETGSGFTRPRAPDVGEVPPITIPRTTATEEETLRVAGVMIPEAGEPSVILEQGTGADRTTKVLKVGDRFRGKRVKEILRDRIILWDPQTEAEQTIYLKAAGTAGGGGATTGGTRGATGTGGTGRGTGGTRRPPAMPGGNR